MIVSFGFKGGKGPPVHAKLFDVRALTHKVDSPEFKQQAEAITTYAAAHPTATIAIGCEKGQHRSVILADRVAKAVKGSVYHRDNSTWGTR